MPDHTSNGMQCNEFELLLADAIDGVLSGTGLDRFQAHARSCKTCGPLLAEAEAGRDWLKGLTEVEPPASLVNNILASTTGVDTQRLRVTVRAPQPRVSWLEHVQAAFLEPIWAVVRQPRFAMSFGMAFFALSVSLTMLGVKPADILSIDLRPTAIRHTYYNTQARIIRYVDNSRRVLEVQAALRGLKRNMNPAEPGPAKQQKEHKNDTTQQPEQKQDRNYSQTGEKLILASAPLGPSLQDLPVVSVTTYRRFV
ncbi:MAG TPA: zf-HC2 domain-containing protein [Candidatus Dormibacteraeota bacterium]|nr:zf-HC2 domain-containing protein [Candidatus Dormibacteraeota bacterium]